TLSLSCDIKSDGSATVEADLGDKALTKKLSPQWGNTHSFADLLGAYSDAFANGRLDKRLLPKAGIFGLDLDVYGVGYGERYFSTTERRWRDWDFYVGIGGEFSPHAAWQEVIPIPVFPYALPVYAKISARISPKGVFQIQSLAPLATKAIYILEGE